MVLEGIVDRIIYRSADSGYTVLEMETQGGREIVVGIMPLVSEGEYIETEGDYSLHRSYGRQFTVSSFNTSLPVSESAILKYLSSGIIKGIGPKTARLIVDRFGPNTFSVLENSPEELIAIRGISAERSRSISESVAETMGVKNILLYFQQFGLTATMAFKVYKEWGLNAYDIIKNNPYRLCDIQGFSFERADQMALQMAFSLDNTDRIRAGITHILMHNLYNNGHTFLPREKLTETAAALLSVSLEEIESQIEKMIDTEKLVYVEKISNANGIYLKWAYESERKIAERLVLASAFSHEYEGNFEKDISKIERKLGIVFAEKQREAIRESVCNGVFILTGGPGTGKTTALKGIVSLLEEKELSYALTAPTGRAAKRMTELCGKEAKTLHRLLEYAKNGNDGVFKKNSENKLEYDVIIVDEASMVDFIIFDSLLSATPLASTIILVGDINQLPPVGPGSVLKDIIGSGRVKTVILDEIFRQAAESLIVTNAHKIINGIFPDLKNTKSDFFFLPAISAEEVLSKVCSLYSERLPSAYGFDPLTQIQVLTPSRKGLCGTVNLNEELKARLNPKEGEISIKAKGKTFYKKDKVMQIKNNYDAVFEKESGEVDLGIFNGDIGEVKTILPSQETLTVLFDDREVVYTPEMIEELEHAYAITVHKSQGSEFDAVILPIWDGPEMLYTRNLLYTAVTRAKKLLIVVGSPEKIDFMIKNNYTNKRYSGLKFKIAELSE